ncbi:DUF1579 domain-containing protein [Taibaiella chishuiensis]|uniref:Uncharacterized protein DUF1579 n=1 Tax=Taibaiella chishuiensis TaxID=1434707 RepID=A0A2P8D1F9_9BACT|nr:DUF1579 domain-containing protein [Taibaiella chishuiensis]PSK91063.1 uncharacterized protein DUF1579 [Taibaiella chishuiensis]
MSKMKFVTSKEAGMHNRLAQLAGNWTVYTRTWFEPGDPADESEMTGQIKPVLDGRFMMHEYSGSLKGKAFTGVALYGYDLSSGRFQVAWVDSFHMGTGIMLSQSRPGSDVFDVKGSYVAGGDEAEVWGWRTELDLPDDGTLVIRAYNISPEGEESIATETVYKRVTT